MNAAREKKTIFPGPIRNLRGGLASLTSSIDSSTVPLGCALGVFFDSNEDGLALNGLAPGCDGGFAPKPGGGRRLA